MMAPIAAMRIQLRKVFNLVVKYSITFISIAWPCKSCKSQRDFFDPGCIEIRYARRLGIQWTYSFQGSPDSWGLRVPRRRKTLGT
jgi:hypothetical protein